MNKKILLPISISIILLSIIIISHAIAKNYYVDGDNSQCNDSANGTEVTPWCTLGKASSALTAGDTVLIKNAIYTETVVPKASGNAGSGYITYEAYTGHNPTIDGQNNRSYGINIQNGSEYLKFIGLTIRNHTNDGIKIKNTAGNDSDYIVIDSCTIVDNNEEGIQATGKSTIDRLSNLTIQNCTIQNNERYGIYIDDYWDYVTVTGNVFFNNGHRGYVNGSCFDNIQLVQDETTYGPNSQTATYAVITNNTVQASCRQGVLVWGDIDNVYIAGNDIYSSGATGIQIEGDSASGGPSNVVIRNNTVWDNCEFCAAEEVWSNAECGIWLDRTDHALVENNTSRANNEGMHFSFKDGNSNLIVRYNTLHQPSNLRAVKIWADSDRIYFYNNTIHNVGVNGSYGGFYIKNKGGSSDYNVIKNNIISQVDHKKVRCDIATTTFDYNLYYDTDGLSFEWIGNTYNSLSAWQDGSGQDRNSIEANPKFVDAANSDFRLSIDSAAIDNGGALTTVDYTDIGSGTNLIVVDSHYFQDGYGISGVHSDWIAVGTVSNIAQITDVNYSTNTITLNSSISRNDGDRVWLYKKSDGKQVLYGDAPDIGAYEYVESNDNLPPDPPTGLQVIN